mgnify:CR=1 FL=1
MAIQLHQTSVGTYHPDPSSDVAWTVNDIRQSLDAGPTCECGACRCCTPQEWNKCPCISERPLCQIAAHHHTCTLLEDVGSDPGICIGLSFAYVCLDGGEALCEACAQAEGLEVKDCDCN